MQKRKTINIAPFDFETETHSKNGFALIFYDHNKKVSINLDLWWIGFIAEGLHKIIAKRQEELDALKGQLKGE